MKAAVYGTVSGILFGLSASLTKPTVEYLHEGVDTMLSHWEAYVLAIVGVLGFVFQQVSLGTGRLAPSVATVSVANPVVSILIGALLLNETLSRPAWHVALAIVGLGLGLAGAVAISLAREEPSTAPAPDDGMPTPAKARSRHRGRHSAGARPLVDGPPIPCGPAARARSRSTEPLQCAATVASSLASSCSTAAWHSGGTESWSSSSIARNRRTT